jgi:hypothetical protein
MLSGHFHPSLIFEDKAWMPSLERSPTKQIHLRAYPQGALSSLVQGIQTEEKSQYS